VVETSDEWITYGLEFVTDGNSIGLQVRSLMRAAALAMAGTPADLDMIILATSTMTYLAVLVKSSPSWEPPEQLPLTLAACSGFVDFTAAQYLRTGAIKISC